jgi:hypothetical protein
VHRDARQQTARLSAAYVQQQIGHSSTLFLISGVEKGRVLCVVGVLGVARGVATRGDACANAFHPPPPHLKVADRRVGFARLARRELA